ncbi:WD repeat domain phosphoinositide-interacting protein 2 isoform X1 [Nomascus leucogenys]|uniref:WD repeat domain phosphoinositide-interacting protein 2 isoform X1 n=1 Tax=Nomascus leucogenys TaxID=61853 RepID=UPI00122D9FA2|nr:WD repeat domain phosphoinositide-interacting protein 2 isoform X1 [Nomascus leucogenys]
MNLASQSGEAGAGQLLFANFNQDNTEVKRASRAAGLGRRAVVWSLAVGSKSGYKFFSLSSVDKLEQIYECTDTEDVCIVERLFSSSLVAIVSLKAPRKLKVCHFKKGTEICNYSYSNTILAVKLNRQRLIVCLEESLYIHNIRDMKVLHTIRETPPNPAGLCALSINNDNCYLAYPGSATIGEVQVFDTINLRAANMIPAHDSPLAALAFDASGTKLATASEKMFMSVSSSADLILTYWGKLASSRHFPLKQGTVIRVFSIPEGQKLFEFRRGVKRCVSICSLAFSMDGMFLSASSNTETVHIFKLETVKEKPPEEPTTWTGYFGKVLMASTSYLPSQVTEMFNQGRAFATVRLPFCGHKNICSLATIQKIPRLLVGAADGYLYMYNLDPQEGGECALMKQHRLDGSLETTNEILDAASHDCPLVTQTYGTAAAKGTYVPSSPTRLAYTDDLGAVGGACLEDEASALRLDEDSEHPPMILRTD